jgi:hypothetical protein
VSIKVGGSIFMSRALGALFGNTEWPTCSAHDKDDSRAADGSTGADSDALDPRSLHAVIHSQRPSARARDIAAEHANARGGVNV